MALAHLNGTSSALLSVHTVSPSLPDLSGKGPKNYELGFFLFLFFFIPHLARNEINNWR